MSGAKQRCAGVEGPIADPSRRALPVLAPKVRHSRMSRRRAAVLIGVNLLLVAHVVQWLVMGVTVAPLEPSESMETVKEGIITVGTVLFSAALLSTLIFGRFFCGWGCHILALEDLCLWLLRKVDIRPHAFRSRFLLLLPLGLALYMFVWPLAYRLAIAPYTRPGLHWPGFTWRLIVEDYWKTFPGVLVAIPFLLICGFATVYLLGGKGYCTYACPYGGFFAPLDRFARGRIRVTDACEHCGHCTSVCTSNVRVHEEVRDFGMVVDPGCMKCMDCISVCPNDALYFGFGPSAAASAPRVAEPAPRKFDLSLREDLALAALAAAIFFCVRGAFGVVPLLFASGIVICLCFLSWKSYRLLSDANESFHGWSLRRSGRLLPAGWALLTITIISLALVAHAGLVQAATAWGGWHDERVVVVDTAVFSADGLAVDEGTAMHARAGLAAFDLTLSAAGPLADAFPDWAAAIDMRRAWLLSVLRRFPEAESTLRARYDADPSEEFARAIARVRMANSDSRPLEAWFAEVVAMHPEFQQLRDERIQWLLAEGHDREALVEARMAVVASGGALDPQRRLSLILIENGSDETEWQEGVDLVRQTLERAPDNAYGWRALALGYARLEDVPKSEQALAEAVRLAPQDARLRRGHADVLEALDRKAEAAAERAEATRLEGETTGAEHQ